MDNVRGKIILLHTAQTRAECSSSGAVQGKARQGRAEIAGILSCSTLLYATLSLIPLRMRAAAALSYAIINKQS
jgi:hypothetical protein